MLKVELLKRSIKDEDGIEKFLFGYLSMALSTILGTYASSMYVYFDEKMTLYKYFIPIIDAILPFSIPPLWIFLGVVALFNFLTCIALIVVFIPTAIMLIYACTVSRSMRSMRTLW